MLYTLHDKNDLIYAYVEFTTVDQYANYQDKGNYIYVQDIWVHKNYRNTDVRLQLYKHVAYHEQCENTFLVYWTRYKNNIKIVKGPYNKYRIIRESKEKNKCLHG